MDAKGTTNLFCYSFDENNKVIITGVIRPSDIVVKVINELKDIINYLSSICSDIKTNIQKVRERQQGDKRGN